MSFCVWIVHDMQLVRDLANRVFVLPYVRKLATGSPCAAVSLGLEVPPVLLALADNRITVDVFSWHETDLLIAETTCLLIGVKRACHGRGHYVRVW